jgi:hypothetical protein
MNALKIVAGIIALGYVSGKIGECVGGYIGRKEIEAMKAKKVGEAK